MPLLTGRMRKRQYRSLKQWKKMNPRSLFLRADADELAQTAPVAKLNNAGKLGEQRIVLAAPDVLAGLKGSAALAHDDRAAGYQFSAEYLHAEPLRVRIAP